MPEANRRDKTLGNLDGNTCDAQDEKGCSEIDRVHSRSRVVTVFLFFNCELEKKDNQFDCNDVRAQVVYLQYILMSFC